MNFSFHFFKSSIPIWAWHENCFDFAEIIESLWNHDTAESDSAAGMTLRNQSMRQAWRRIESEFETSQLWRLKGQSGKDLLFLNKSTYYGWLDISLRKGDSPSNPRCHEHRKVNIFKLFVRISRLNPKPKSRTKSVQSFPDGFESWKIEVGMVWHTPFLYCSALSLINIVR